MQILKPQKIKLLTILIHKIKEYSPKKINANFNPPYSILKPDTNSDSPSDKSKGARLVSTTHTKNLNKKKPKKKKTKKL